MFVVRCSSFAVRGGLALVAQGVVEDGGFGEEEHVDGADGAVAVLADDDFGGDGQGAVDGLAGFVAFGFLAFAMDEEDEVGVLFDGT